MNIFAGVLVSVIMLSMILYLGFKHSEKLSFFFATVFVISYIIACPVAGYYVAVMLWRF